ncbi:MAG: formate dehydrogenase accessory sulfurtransferase FdhD [Hyphomicrobiaceae bacterium]
MTQMPKSTEIVKRAAPLCSRLTTGETTDSDGTAREIDWQLPDEVPIALLLNSQPYTVMMATPAHLTDFGRGFVIAEGIVSSTADVRRVLVLPADTGSTLSSGYAVDVAVDEQVLAGSRLAPRSMEGRSGCGLCGVSEIADVVRVPKQLPERVRPTPQAILTASDALPSKQPMNRLNRSVHAAAWVSLDGSIMLVREDVGRHNALDKLIGALAQSNTDLTSGFVLMTSRCSFELVQKAATFGIGALVTVSAPTALALDIAKASGLYLAALGAGGVVVFNS